MAETRAELNRELTTIQNHRTNAGRDILSAAGFLDLSELARHVAHEANLIVKREADEVVRKAARRRARKTPPKTFKSMYATRERDLPVVGTATLTNTETGEVETVALYDTAAWLRAAGKPV